MVGVHYRLPGAWWWNLLLQLQDALVLLEDFNCPDVCWESSTVSCRQSRRLQECMEDNFLTLVINSPAREDALLDLFVTNTRQLIGNIKVRGNLHCSDHAWVKSAILRSMGQVRVKLGPWRLGKQTSNSSGRQSVGSSRILPSGTREKNKAWLICKEGFYRT